MYPSLASVAEWQTDLCPVQGIRQAPRRGRGWEGLCPHFSWDSNYVIRDLASDIRGSFFFIIWRIDIRNKEQLKLLSKLLLRLLILDSFPAISEDFKSFSHLSAPLKNPLRRKGRTETIILNLISAYFQGTENTKCIFFRTRNNFLDPRQFTCDTRQLDYLVFPVFKSENNFVKEILLRRRLGFSLICLWILQNVRFGFYRLWKHESTFS